MQPAVSVIKGTAQEVMAALALIPADQPVRAFVGHPGLVIIAREPQAIAAANGMTEEVHDDLIRSLKTRGLMRLSLIGISPPLNNSAAQQYDQVRVSGSRDDARQHATEDC